MAHERVYIVGKSKSDNFLHIFIALLLLGFGAWQLAIPSDVIEGRFKNNNPYIVHFFGVWFIAFSIYIISNSILKICSKGPSIILNESGLKISRVTQIHWSEIDSFILSYKFKYGRIYVKFKDQQAYINKHNRLRRFFLRFSAFGVPSPVYISGQFLLNIGLKELLAVLNYELENFNRKT